MKTMKILMLVNWKVERCASPPKDRQPPDYVVKGEPYWFYRYFRMPVEVDVLDISSFPALEHFEKEKLRFYVIQALRAIPKMGRYDLVVSHGMQSGVAVSLFRRFFPGKARHVVFDIGSFNSAAESGGALRLMQFSSRSIDGLIYHTGMQKEYYRKHFPWILPKSRFIPFGTDSVFFSEREDRKEKKSGEEYILCVGYHKRDWDTLTKAYGFLAKKHRKEFDLPALRLVGKPDYCLPASFSLPEGAILEKMPYIPVQELMDQIAGALFCVVPLEYFNYSFGQMTLLQQMAMGKAVISAKVPSMLDYVQEGEDGLFYEPGNAEELCAGMERLLEDPAFRENMGRKAAFSVKVLHNEKKMAQKIEAFYQEVLEGK